jgi:hypothetical protein
MTSPAPTPARQPRPALEVLNEALATLKELPQNPDIFFHPTSLVDALKRLEDPQVGFDTREHRAQITPELMTAVVRTTLSNYFGKLHQALHEFNNAEYPTRVANLTPNVVAHIGALESVAARFDVKVSDLYPKDYDNLFKQFRELWSTREHSYDNAPLLSPYLPLMQIAFSPQSMEELRMPRATL